MIIAKAEFCLRPVRPGSFDWLLDLGSTCFAIVLRSELIQRLLK